jgi:hypothetical protein
MFIYNVTVNVEDSIKEDWITWMKEKHIPEVMQSGCFTSHRICKVLHVQDEGVTYSVQYFFNTMEDIERYQREFAPRLQQEHKARYGERALAFRTLLQLVD